MNDQPWEKIDDNTFNLHFYMILDIMLSKNIGNHLIINFVFLEEGMDRQWTTFEKVCLIFLSSRCNFENGHKIWL